jgi:hypothetical protein
MLVSPRIELSSSDGGLGTLKLALEGPPEDIAPLSFLRDWDAFTMPWVGTAPLTLALMQLPSQRLHLLRRRRGRPCAWLHPAHTLRG